MSDNVLIAIVAACGVIIAAVCVLGAAMFAYIAGGKEIRVRLDKIDTTLATIQSDMREFYRMHYQLEAKVDKKP